MRVSLGEGSCGYPSLIFKRGQITLDTAQKSLSLRNCGSGGSGSAAGGLRRVLGLAGRALSGRSLYTEQVESLLPLTCKLTVCTELTKVPALDLPSLS